MDLKEINSSTEYMFTLKKGSSYKKKALLNVDSKGKFNLLIAVEEEEKNLIKYTFTNLVYEQKDVKDSLIFNPVIWYYNQNLNLAAIKDRDSFKKVWERYRDKHRNANNRSLFNAIERLYFHTPLGLESDIFSNGVYLPFFIKHEHQFEVGRIYPGQDYYSIPLNLPLQSSFKCVEINDKYIIMEGWITLNEERLDLLLQDNSFIRNAKSYHSSLDFSLQSKILVKIDKVLLTIQYIKHWSEVKGENDLYEGVEYEVYTNQYFLDHQIFKTYKGRNFTKAEWEEYERQKSLNASDEGFWNTLFRGSKQKKDDDHDDYIFDPFAKK